MAQTQSHQFSSQPFSPPISSPSPGAPSPVNVVAPPPKRQRLSPLPQSQPPYASSSFGSLQLQHTGAPVNGGSANGISNPLMNAPPPGSMGPPSRPAEKPTDTAELTDVLASSGIDVREEEAYLTHSYGTTAPHSQPPPRLQTNFNTSFNSQTSVSTTISAGNSFTEQSQYKQVPLQSPLYATGAPIGSTSLKTPEQTAADEELRENTLASRREQYHLQAPFLFTALVEERLQKRGYELGVRMPTQGVYRPFPGRNTGPVEITGPDGSSIVRTGKTLLTQDAALGDILSLISLSCEERLRGVIDQAATLAKNRRINSHGAVPPEWSDLAVGSAASREDPQGVPDSAVSPKTIPQKRSISASQDAQGKAVSSEAKISTASNKPALRGRILMNKDASSEEGRATKRARRSADAILGGENSRAGSIGISTPGAVTPTGQVSDRAPDTERKATKKEMKKAESKITGAVQHQHAVETARMATNNLTSGVMFGGKKKTYSWLTSSAPTASRSGFSTPTRINTNTGGSGANAAGKGGAGPGAGNKPTGRRLGDWREDDKERGAGIQIRDILLMLEVDGKAVKHLQKAYSKETKEDVDKN